ncbi:competence/damage-inducible protein A [Paenibacillus urinalis]|uniref:Putative competence-damage inducible protein n=1 Tax=Paenibacillus urinalis TaxID=521520 RepID=A0AAX3N763_9BACL|nr:competence/damage-inducible protein A [Paenibacillus urinalis]WDH84554.1 competence/damage-inducible protein A [Paenibacillus urinalis]WDH96019.1 competence/damage-inducible protein A [Paenibacillus urinalis]WDI04239.1 competence/damage-inducible protein A [Paenibacillus urinalis]
MKAEIIAVGTELLLGQIVNTNAQFLSKELAAIGIDVYFQTVVGDNALRMKQSIETAQSRADIIIFSGGIGPTQDDITKDVVAELLGRELHIEQRSLDKIEQMFTSRGTLMTENNKRQATLIEGATPLTNETGLALGNAIFQDDHYYIILPGPPKELKPMFSNHAVPWLQQHALTGEMPIYSKMLKFAGIGESMLEDKLKDLISAQTDPTIAPYAGEGEVTVRISTKAGSESEAMVKLNELEVQIQQRLPEHLYASHDIPIEHVIVEMMADRELTLGAAESCTGGLLMELLTSIPGSGTMLRGGIVCYTNEMKEKLLNVPHAYLEGEDAPGAVSPEVAKVLAEQVRMITDADYGLAVTGVAGPGYSERKKVGLVYIGIAERGGETEIHELNLSGNRETIRIRSAKTLLYRLWRKLVENEKLD